MKEAEEYSSLFWAASKVINTEKKSDSNYDTNRRSSSH